MVIGLVLGLCYGYRAGIGVNLQLWLVLGLGMVGIGIRLGLISSGTLGYC